MKPASYYTESRIEIDDLLPPVRGAVLEIGAANLEVARRLLASMPQIERYDYIEPFGEPSFTDARLRKVGELVERWVPHQSVYTLILALDVIEHIADTKELLAKLRLALVPGGYLVASVPNIAHYSVIRRLIAGKFEYTRSGILDETHLKFFTPRSFDSVLSRAGFVKQKCLFKNRRGRKCFFLRTHRCYQYLSVWRVKADESKEVV